MYPIWCLGCTRDCVSSKSSERSNAFVSQSTMNLPKSLRAKKLMFYWHFVVLLFHSVAERCMTSCCISSIDINSSFGDRFKIVLCAMRVSICGEIFCVVWLSGWSHCRVILKQMCEKPWEKTNGRNWQIIHITESSPHFHFSFFIAFSNSAIRKFVVIRFQCDLI